MGRTTILRAAVLVLIGVPADVNAQTDATGGVSVACKAECRSQVAAAEVRRRTEQVLTTNQSTASGGATLTRVRGWNLIATTAVAIDHTPTQAGESRVAGENAGPARTARALAIVHIALFEAVNAVAGGYQSYLGLTPDPAASIDAAIAKAAHDALVGTYPTQRPFFDRLLAIDLGLIPSGSAKTRGIALGRRAAAAILAVREDDGSQHMEPLLGIDYTPPSGPGFWSQDPVSQLPIALSAYWSQVAPFVIESADQFRAPAPPDLASAEYAAAFGEVKRLGGCGTNPSACIGGSPTPTYRTRDQTMAGIYWAYDGTPGLGTPPRLYNQIALVIAANRGSTAIELARLLALVNVGLADAALSSWETKYHYVHWRPVTAIRAAAEDGNPATKPDPRYTPLGAPATNMIGEPNFTPPFPAYTSGHSVLGSTFFEILREFYGTDAIAFSFVSDELNGINRDNRGNRRPLVKRSFSSLSQAEDENGRSRIYLGIHWDYDRTVGQTQGRSVGAYVMANVFQPQ
jgi:hypothetical protein